MMQVHGRNGMGNDAHTKLLVHANGVDTGTTFIDSSPSAFGLTAGNSANTSTTAPKFGNASWNGTQGGGSGGGYVVSGSNIAAMQDFTLEAWCKMGADLVTTVAFNIDQISSGEYFGWRSATPGWELTAGGIYYSGIISVAYDTNYHHLAFTRKNGIIRAFFDGVLKYTSAVNTTPTLVGLFLIGAARSTGINGFYGVTGYLDEFRISDIARWITSFTPPNREH